MLYLIVGISLMFILIAFIVRESNAKYILSGYNTMSNEEKENFDLKSYIGYYRRFHIFLGVSFFIIGFSLLQLVGENSLGIFMGSYPIIAYIFFLISSSRYSNKKGKKKTTIAVGILALTLVFILALFNYGHRETKIIITDEQIEFSGHYGEIINLKDIDTMYLAHSKPELKYRINGFASGDTKKGYFRTSESEKVKLILNSSNKPYIYIKTKEGREVYYSSGEKDNAEIFEDFIKAWK